MTLTIDGEYQIKHNSITSNWQLEGLLGQNLFDSSTKQIHFLADGGYKEYPLDIKNLMIKARVGESKLRTVEVETKVRKWSDPASWPHGSIPKAGEDVIIEASWNMTYDLQQSPVYNMLTINGRLKFSDQFDQTLNAKVIFVREGELLIGDEQNPYQH